MRIKKTSKYFIFFSLFFIPSAWADIPNSLKVYTVWNQFDATVNAFQKLALIMSDNNYQGLFFGMFVIGLVAGGLMAVAKGLFRGANPYYVWLSCLGVFVAGAMIYGTFIRSTTTITIYDEVLNEMMVVPGIPDGVAFIAGFANKIETGLIEMIWTAGDPRSYRENAGGLAYNIFTKAFQGGVDLTRCGADGKYMNSSLARYTKDCFLYEVGRPGTTLDVNDINDNTDFMPLYALAANPAMYTVYYDSAHKTGQTCTCQQAWANLSDFLSTLTPANACVQKFWAERCSRAGLGNYSSVGSGQNLRLICENKAANFVSNYILGGAGMSSSLIMRQILIGHHIWDVITESPAEEAVLRIGGRSAGLSMIGMGILSNEWIPIIRSVSFCIFIGLIPFVCLLIPTPICGRAVAFIFGIFVFLTSWGICDALVHSFAMDKTLDLLDEIRNYRLGLSGIMLFKSDAQKALAVFGAARWSAMMLAGSMSMMLVKFGGATFGHFAGRMTAAGAAGSAAGGLGGLDPQATNSYMRSQVETGPMMTYANHNYKDSIGSGAYSAESNIRTATGTMGAMGGNAVSAGSTMGGANVVKNRESVAHGDAVGRAENVDSGFVGKNAERSVSNQSGWIQGVEAQNGNVPMTSRIEGMTSGAESEAVAGFQSEHGIEAVGNVAYRNQLNNAAKQTAIKARNEIAGSGGISSGTMAAMQRIDQDPQGGHTMMNRHLQGMEFTPAPGGETNNVAGYFGIQPSDIAGKAVRMSGYLGKNGGLKMSMVDAKSGRAIAEKDVKTSQGQPAAGQSRVGPYNFVSVDSRKEFGNGLVMQSGLTDRGHHASVVSDGSGRVISSDVKKGPNYSGAYAMSMGGNIPEEVLNDKVAAASFSRAFSNEASKLWKGSVSRGSGEGNQWRLTGGAGGNLGLGSGKGASGSGMPLSGNVSGNIQKISMSDNTWTKNYDADAVNAMVYNIATSDMKDSDKMRQIHEIAERIGEDRSITPEETPGANYMMTGEEESKPANGLKRTLNRKPQEPPEL